MNFARFADSIISPDLKAVAEHWRNARATRRMPSWESLRPAAIARQLPIVWSYFYDTPGNDFVGRLSGAAMTRIFGVNIKGTKLSQLDSVMDSQRLIAQAIRVMREPALVRIFGPMFVEREKVGVGECIIMPLGANGTMGDAIFGATDCRLSGHVPVGIEKTTGAEDWWPLGQTGAIEADLFPADPTVRFYEVQTVCVSGS